MNFIVEKADFLKNLAVVSAVADKSNRASASILVEARKDGVYLSATDLVSSVQRKVDVKPKTEGAFIVPAASIVDRVKSMPAGPVSLSLKESTLTIKAMGSPRKFTIQTGSADDFPKMPMVDTSVANKISKKDLLSLTRSVQNAVCDDPSRANVNSALLEWQDGKISMTATNGHALVHASTPLDVVGGQEVMLPKTAIDQLAKMLEQSKEQDADDVSISFNGSHATFKVGSAKFTTAIPEAKFPPYQQIVPKGRKDFIPVNRAKMIESCKAISVASEKGIDGGIVFDVEGGKVKLSASSSDNGTAYDELPTEYAGAAKRVYLQAGLVVSNLANIAKEEVLLSIEGPLDMVTVSVKGDDSVMGLLMPIRE